MCIEGEFISQRKDTLQVIMLSIAQIYERTINCNNGNSTSENLEILHLICFIVLNTNFKYALIKNLIFY